MMRTFYSNLAWLPGLLAASFLGLLPTSGRAETVTFRNECQVPIVVQTSTVVRGVVVRDKPCLLRKGDYTPKIALNNDKIVTVYDARSNQVLFRDVLKHTPRMDLGYSIQPDPKLPGRVRLLYRKVGGNDFMEAPMP